MAFVLKASNVATDTSFISKALGGDEDEVWVSLDVAYEAAALALWTSDTSGTTTYSGNFVTLYTDTGGGDHNAEIVFIDGAAPGAEWVIANPVGGGTSGVSSSGVNSAIWHTIEVHYLRNSLCALYIDTVLVVSGVAPDEAFIRLTVGQETEAPLDPDAFCYIGNVKIGTTRGASDLFIDDFETGDLSAWDSSTGEVEVVSTPVLGGTTTSPTGVCVAFDDPTLEPGPSWTRLDEPGAYDFVAGWTIKRGRSSELDKTGTGTATITLFDTDGSLDPTNPAGPFYGNLDPMKQAGIALHNPVTDSWHTIFRGFVSDWLYDMDVSEKFSTVTLECSDAFDLLSALEMTPNHHGDTAPAGSEGDIFFENRWAYLFINKALDDAGWPASLRQILTGNVIVGSANPINGHLGVVYARRDQLLTVLFDCADAEFPGVSNVYVDKVGRVTFHGRYARFEPTNPDYQIDFWSAGDKLASDGDDTVAPISGLSYRRSKDDIINASLMIPQGVDESLVPGSLVKDDTSIAKYGWRSISFDNLLTFKGRVSHDTTDFTVSAVDETKLYSDYYVNNYKNPRTRVTKVTFRPKDPNDFSAAALWELMCKIDIGDVLHLDTTHLGEGGFDEDFYVEGISYTAAPMRTDIHDVTLELDVSPASLYAFNPFADTSEGGGSTPTITGPNSPPQVGDTLTGNP